jgi:hypothetical protein
MFFYAIPLGLALYFPSLVVLEKPDVLGMPEWMCWLALPMSLTFLGLASWIWRVGVNKYQDNDEHDLPTLKINQESEDEQVAFVRKTKARRDKDKLGSALRRIAEDAKADRNVLPAVLEAVKTYASVGEICDVFREVYGVYRDPANF